MKESESDSESDLIPSSYKHTGQKTKKHTKKMLALEISLSSPSSGDKHVIHNVTSFQGFPGLRDDDEDLPKQADKIHFLYEWRSYGFF